ncbi:zinc-ribbon domain-containing protein [Lactiplantibacillus garii]|uniref:Zinc-ribbon domain-containing protein n=1 Tax=Lactiplantibacillus garii TaxID=2306423 RepID=A0A3R8J4X8_9LACO|nr:zinc-ribbon domain-containing protein [Lactiplantibacillus garii]RRK09216.1 zinc-ribbon domain-containing protein [Lactiplantibacillus garii]
MKHCTNCGFKLETGTKFCPKCGQAIKSDQQSGDQERTTVQRGEDELTNDTVVKTTPRISKNQQSMANGQTKTRNNSLVIAILVILVVVSGFLFIKKRMVVSRDQLASNVTKAVQNQDGKLFLKQFSKDDQALKFSDVGAKSVVKDIHNHSRDSLSETGRIIVNGQHVSGTKVKYYFNVESKKVMGMFTSYYLTTRRTPVRVLDYTESGGPVTIKLKDANNQRVSKQQLSSGFFPGKYNFDVRSGDTQGDYWIWAAGDGETIDLTLTSDD